VSPSGKLTPEQEISRSLQPRQPRAQGRRNRRSNRHAAGAARSDMGEEGGNDSDPGRVPLSVRQRGRGAVDRGWLADRLGAHDAQCPEGRGPEPR